MRARREGVGISNTPYIIPTTPSVKSRVLETLALLLVAGIMWGMAAWVVRLERADKTTTHAETMRIQGRVQTALRLAGLEADHALDRVRRFPRAPFGAPMPKEAAPCFVFSHDSLVYWSDHTLTNEFDLPPEPYSYRSAETRRGKVLLVVRGYGGRRGYRAAACVLLESRYGISNRYLTKDPNPAIFGAMQPRLIIDEKALLPQIRATDGTYLFSLAPDPGSVPIGSNSWLPLGLLVAGAVMFILAWVRIALPLWRRGRRWQGVLTLLVPLVALRAALLTLNLPFALADLALFDPKYYAASWLAPSLGDQLLNALLMCLMATLALAWYRRAHVGRTLSRRLSAQRRELLALGCVVLLGLLLAYRYRVYQDTFDNTPLDLDISQSVTLNWLKLLLAVLLVLHSVVGGVVLYLLTSIGNRLLPARLRGRVWRLLLAGEIGLWIAAFQLGSHAMALGALTLLFAKGVLVISERQRIRGVSYPQTVFLIAAVALWALIGALAQKRHHERQLRAAEQKLATSLLIEHDVLSEYLLEEVGGKIAIDPLVARSLKSTFPQTDIARQKIEKYYLRDYFTQYETSIRFFDGTGREFGAEKLDTTRGLDQLRRRLMRTAKPTEHTGLYLVNNTRTLTERRYVKLVRLPDMAGSAAPPPTIALELSLKKLTPYGVVPELLIDQKYAPAAGPLAVRALSYAVFGRKGLLTAEGDYDYSDWRPGANLFREKGFYIGGVEFDGAHHLGVRAGNGTTLVLSTPAYTAGDVLSNFSFLFLLHLIAGMGGLTIVLLFTGQQLAERRLRASLSTKIQVLLNLGTLIPLLVVSGATAAVSSAAYQRDLVTTYQQRGVRVQQNLIRAGRFIQARDAGREELNDLMKDVANLSETDILLYNPEGQLLTASQPLLFETGVLSRLLNSEAMAALRERGQPRVLVTERAGSLVFNALYLPLPNISPDGGPRVVGFIGIPFFDSEKALDLKLTELMTTMMNIFTVMFIVFLLIAFLASRRLTAPLKLLAEKLKQTTLTGQNERLDYQTPDEIGLLVDEYNQMLTKLEDSRRELAMRAQEAAWREMARQVAHEIKNPLTPMKLSLQYLQRVIHDGRDNVEALIDKVSKTLITQIDTLSDIASSFSSFIALPEPKPERLELLALLRHCLDLHPGTANKPVDTTMPLAWVVADKSLLVRTFNNLLLNALQAIPADREPLVRASVKLEGSMVLVGIHDNGTGIPAEVQPKVFVPNFSTKFSGSGIGLAVAKRAIESAGGQLWFETEEDEGTSFYLTLPLVAATDSTA